MLPILCALLVLTSTFTLAEQTSTATSKALNPDISTNFLGLYKFTNRDADDAGPTLQEVETQFTADVDPYLRAVALLSLAREGGEFKIEPEEVYTETLSIPGVTFRAGKFKAALGRHNRLHSHAFPFIDAPLIHQTLLGGEGLNEVGGSAAVLMPFPWFSEVTLQGLQSDNEGLFKSGSRYAVVPVAHLKNLWDLSDASTVELGFSGAGGRNQWGETTSILGADLTYKWRPTQGGKYTSFVWSTEFLSGNRAGRPSDDGSPPALGGIASWVQYQFAERWWAQTRAEYMGPPLADDSVIQRKYSALLAFLPSEFSGLRLQYSLMDDGSDKMEHMVQLQLNVSIGAHPAHAY